MPGSHIFERKAYTRDTCSTCGKPKSEHKEVPSADEMRELLRELADCLCGLRIVNSSEKQALLDRLAKYRST